MTERLTPARLFAGQPLTGSPPIDLKFSPDAKRLIYRRSAQDDRQRMDLWQIDLQTKTHSLWIDARALPRNETETSTKNLTKAERAERERRRQFSYGINQYLWHPDKRHMLVPIQGQAYLVDTEHPNKTATTLCPSETRQSGFQISPRGDYLSYVRAGNLFITDFQDDTERQITEDASDTLSNGLPDFLAAEEMHRFEGHWWSQDDQYLVFCKVDEASVNVSFRLEMEASGTQTIGQRYPYAGEANPSVSLWLYHLETQRVSLIWKNDRDNDADSQAYLARVHLAKSKVLIQTQDRRQQHLRIFELNLNNALETGAPESIQWQERYRESSSTWINLNHNLKILTDQNIVLTTEETGTAQIKIIKPDGAIERLGGPTHINAVLDANPHKIYVTGWTDTPLENHLFEIDIAEGGCQQITSAPGWHDVVVNVPHEQFIDRYSHESLPLQIDLSDLTADPRPVSLYRETITKSHPYAPFLPMHAYPYFGEVKAEDGQTLHYRLTPPAKITGLHPTIVYVYGGPGPQKAKREWSPLITQLFAQHGFAVLELDNRGSGNRGHQFEAPIYRNLGLVEVRDQVAGLSALEDYPWADQSRVGIYGHSYGGYMTIMCLAQAHQHFHAGVAVAPVSDWHLYDTHYTERYMGLPEENTAGYEQANVLTHIHKLQAPLLLMHGMADDNVLFTHSTMIMGKLQALGLPFELMTYPGAKHSMQEQDVSIHRFNLILDFFSRRLGGHQ